MRLALVSFVIALRGETTLNQGYGTLDSMSDSRERVVVRYWDGTEAQVGDRVTIDETQQGIVRDVVDTQEKMKKWGLDEFGLMFDCVFYPERFLREYPVELVSRAGA